MMRLIKRLGFKTVTDFYQNIADETLDVNEIIDKYLEQQRRENDTHDDIIYRSAEGYNLQQTQNDEITRSKEGKQTENICTRKNSHTTMPQSGFVYSRDHLHRQLVQSFCVVNKTAYSRKPRIYRRSTGYP